MLLSKPRILKYLQTGHIVCDPFVPQNLGSAQMDVTLGENIYREMTIGERVYNPFDEGHVRNKWTLDRAVVHREWATENGRVLTNIGPDEKIVFIAPGETILAHTQEFIGGACDFITTMMKARSSTGRNFIEVCKCAGMGDVGYFNRWTMEITNNSRFQYIPLVVGRRIAQILFFEVDPVSAEDVYDRTGKYQNSKSLQQLKDEWTPETMLPKQWRDRECRK